MRKIRVKEKLSQPWVELLFLEQKCDDNVAQHNSADRGYGILLQQNQLNSKVMQTKKVSFGQAIVSGWKNCFNSRVVHRDRNSGFLSFLTRL